MDTKEKIINTAYDLFLSKGYKDTTVRAIAKAANVNLGLIPYHFGTKERLGVEVYKIMTDHLAEKIDYDEIDFDDSIEEYYYSYLMLQYRILENEATRRYYEEFLEEADLILSPQQHTLESIDKITKDYNIFVSPEMIQLYYQYGVGGERAIVAKKRRGEIDISYATMNALYVRALLSLLGICPLKVELAIERVDRKMKNLDFDWSLLY